MKSNGIIYQLTTKMYCIKLCIIRLILMYALHVWSHSVYTNKKKLQVIQQKNVSIIYLEDFQLICFIAQIHS